MRKFLPLLLGALLLVFVLPGAAAAKPKAGLPIDVTAVPADAGATVDGTFTLTRFAVQNGELVGIVKFAGTVTDAAGASTTGSQTLALPVDITAATCAILHLTLGPLDLDLLGLQVHLDQVVLNIDAQSGPGNLLGNLLCAVAGLLDGGGPLTGIAALLNQILGILQGL
ncbi:MAG TPA: hypothetical protein VFN41_09025 [Candidatus Limnocylindrales bacterium]|nr:hypothetical protein [Candidatus Limnocylindrales bacterium]